MGQKALPPARVYVHTLGCPKNEADSRGLSRALLRAGIEVTEEPAQASHIIINTCGFIREAKEESIGTILEACAGYPQTPVIVAGCLVERYHDELTSGLPEVKAWFGLLTAEEQRRLLDYILREERPIPSPDAVVAKYRNPSSHAYLKISDGCDGPCTFCAIPQIKGPYQAVGPDEIQAEAEACLAEGARELVLVGQNTICWEHEGRDLLDLIEALATDPRVFWIRVMYLQPEQVTERFLRYMAEQPKLCHYLDVPFQHSHPVLLRRMGRIGDRESYLELLASARRLMPDVAVRSAFIVGFPGETPEHFDHLLDFVRDAELDYAAGFTYSPEEGTLAAKLRPRVRRSVAIERLNRLQAAIVKSAEEAHQRLVGTKVQVMVDAIGPEDSGEEFVALGRTRGQAPEVDGVTYIEGTLPVGTMVGDVIEVRIEAAVGYDLVGFCDVS